MHADEKRYAATVEQADDDVVVLDVEGHAVRVPRELLPGAVREGTGFTITIARAPAAERALAESVRGRLAALTAGASAASAAGANEAGADAGKASGAGASPGPEPGAKE